MNLNIFILVSFIAFTTGDYICSDSDCHECVGAICNLSCQGTACRNCPSGDCCNGNNNCNVCIGSVCCSTAKCNRCVIEERQACDDSERTSSKCNDLILQNCELNSGEQVSENRNINALHHNITTIIRIRNLINNTNIIDTPIQLNLTNVNDMILNRTDILLKSLEGRKSKCCSVVHPQECHKIPGIPNNICFTRRHEECSELCNNATNILIKISSTKQCITIAVHPYYYCGYYSTEDCTACFNCTEVSKVECLEESTCSNTCRASILPRKFYNVPYYKKASNNQSTGNEELPPAE